MTEIEKTIAAWRAGAAKLAGTKPPLGWRPGRWRVATEDAAHVAEIWSEHAIGMGWDVRDVFGLDPDAPGLVRGYGVAMLLSGGVIHRWEPDKVMIQSGSPPALSSVPKIDNSRNIPAWELLK